MALECISCEWIADVEYAMPGSAGAVRGDALFSCSDSIVIETVGHGPQCAVFLRAGPWRRPFYSDFASLEALIRALPQAPVPRFVALPECLWHVCSKRWPSVHFHEHELWRHHPEARYEDSDAVDILTEDDLSQCVAMQPFAGEYGGQSYMQWLIRRRRGRGIRISNRLRAVGFVLDDNVIGFVRVDDRDRRRGLGSALIQCLSEAAWATVGEATGFVSVMNSASQALVSANGWVRTDIRTAWVRERTPDQIKAYEEGRF